MAKLVSIIYPTKKRHLGLILDSLSTIVYQKYQSWELIVVKDSSFDFESLTQLVYNHCRNKIKIIDAPSDCGVSVARNIGIENARGSYIAYLDDDDLWSDDYLQNQISILESSDADLIYCNYHLRTQLFNDIEKKYVQHFISIPYNVNPFNRDILLTESFIHLSTVVHTRDVIQLVKFSDKRSFSEWKFLLQASKLFRFHANSQTLVTIQRRLDNTNSRTELNNESVRNQIHIIKEFDSEISDEETRKIRDMIFETYCQNHKSKEIDESKKLENILYVRGPEYAFGYLQMLLQRREINASICRIGQDIALLNKNKELAEDFEFLSLWYDGKESDKYATFQPKYFERINEQWIALL